MKPDEATQYAKTVTTLIDSYCAWASKQALNRTDLLLLGLGPVALLAIGLSTLPAWLGTPLLVILAGPALYAIFQILRAYARRGRK